ncbi:MAG: RNA pseudouridine synthase, partial [Clostridia bacterium]
MEQFDYKKLEILYEDNHIIVVVKPQNIPTQADSSNDLDMLSVVKDYIVNKYNKVGDAYVGMVHRLDRPTGGVMVFAKTSKAAQRLCECIKDGTFEKQYLCVTCGEPKQKKAKLEHYLKKQEEKNTVIAVPMMTDGAKRAELDYNVLETIQNFSLVKIDLKTGRSHQIRVQMAAIGCPLFADAKYGADPKTWKHKMGLWATQIRFPHPITKDMMTFICYPPVEEVPWKAFNVSLHLNIGIVVSPYDQYIAKKDLN